jgi:hypothetical protein
MNRTPVFTEKRDASKRKVEDRLCETLVAHETGHLHQPSFSRGPPAEVLAALQLLALLQPLSWALLVLELALIPWPSVLPAAS